ncbi:MAG: Fic family protein [Bdellovibrionaceae bacterium]|nr:Fic family protein [Pseudobdellovibrionaceae bacterium]
MADIFPPLEFGGNMADNRLMSQYTAIKQTKIPFKIKLTDKFVQSLMKIAECKPFLDEVLTTPLELQLHRQAQIKAITYSNQIEGNKLDEKAVTTLIGSKSIKTRDKDSKEILNYQSALSYAETLAQEKKLPSIRDFCDLQKLVTQDFIQKNQHGRLRTIPVSIVNESTNTVIEKCPNPTQVPFLMDELWQWLKENEDTNPFAKAFAFHYLAVAIHPFADGNGRTVRLFQQVLLLQSGETIARYVPSETIIMRNRSRYYAAIRQCKALQSTHPMTEFMAEYFATAAKEVVEGARSLFEKSKKVSPEQRLKQILKFAKSQPSFQMKDIVELLPDTARRTLERDVESLVNGKKIKMTGEKKGRRYSIN